MTRRRVRMIGLVPSQNSEDDRHHLLGQWDERAERACQVDWPVARAGHVAVLDEPRGGMWLHGGYTTCVVPRSSLHFARARWHGRCSRRVVVNGAPVRTGSGGERRPYPRTRRAVVRGPPVPALDRGTAVTRVVPNPDAPRESFGSSVPRGWVAQF